MSHRFSDSLLASCKQNKFEKLVPLVGFIIRIVPKQHKSIKHAVTINVNVTTLYKSVPKSVKSMYVHFLCNILELISKAFASAKFEQLLVTRFFHTKVNI